MNRTNFISVEFIYALEHGRLGLLTNINTAEAHL